MGEDKSSARAPNNFFPSRLCRRTGPAEKKKRERAVGNGRELFNTDKNILGEEEVLDESGPPHMNSHIAIRYTIWNYVS